jgi:diketogulonate reductase-like aldo/keto reductase
MVNRTIDVRGVEVPRFLYGTAWKEERTESLVSDALAIGFRGIDTANQRRHYDEAGVGAALAEVIGRGEIPRESLFLQTKYTYPEGQDHRLPYDARAGYAEQVRQSFASSLVHLGLERIDSYLLHGPREARGLTAGDREVWQEMERLHLEGRVGLIGMSNVSAEQLQMFCQMAEVPPAFVQNRCFASLGWDRQVRQICRREGIFYQGFSLLTANRAEMRSSEVGRIAERHATGPAQVIFRFALQVGMICLTGTTDPEHMREDLEVFDFELSDEDVATMESLSG